MKSSRLQDYYSAIIASGRAGVPTMREARRDLDRAFSAADFRALTS